VEQTLSRLRELGVGCPSTTSGTGYSSLTCWRGRPSTEVKIDRSFISTMHSPTESKRSSARSSSFAAAFHLDVVAEGIETNDQEMLLRSSRLSPLQGFLYSKPVPAPTSADQLNPHCVRRRDLAHPCRNRAIRRVAGLRPLAPYAERRARRVGVRQLRN